MVSGGLLGQLQRSRGHFLGCQSRGNPARLVWQKEIWQLHVITLVTSALLIWVSERKLLPTMVAFNTLWIGLSSVVIVRNLL